jgi:hypothetical protein
MTREENGHEVLDRLLKEDAVRSYDLSALSFFKQLNKMLIMKSE